MSPKCISASATPQPHSTPSAHIHPSRGGRRSLRVFLFCVLQHFLTPRAGFGRPGRGLGSGFSGSGGEMARRNRPSYSWVKIGDFVTRPVNTAKYRKTSALGSLTHPSLPSAHAGIYMPSGRARGGSGPCIGLVMPSSGS